jgi:hypothetical protein
MPAPTLSTSPLTHPAMDYAFLRQEGIRHLERMAGARWTDFNAHDPGITILEQLCYAITDLAYRIDYELPDLLAREGEDAYANLYTPAQILTSQPVTLTDLRKVVIDVAGVKNAWIEKVTTPAVPLYYDATPHTLRLQDPGRTAEPLYLKGLYRVLVEKSDLLDIDGTVVQREVARRLHAHRNLCEDFEEIRVLERQPIQVRTRVVIGSVEDVEAVLLDIYQRIAAYISPAVPFYTLTQLCEAGRGVDDIFSGPLLEHGFIDSEALAIPRRTALHTSDLIREIMDVAGVVAVRTIRISAGGPEEAWALELDANRSPKLDLEGSKIELERNQLTASIDAKRVRDAYYQNLRQHEADRPLSADERDLRPPSGRDRGVGRYYALQHQLPAAYGIAEMGLPASATPQRQAQAKQLKAYLMFFDQLLANYFAQLAHVKDLFAFDGNSPQTYFSRVIDDATLGLDEIRLRKPSDHGARLQQISANPHASAAASERQTELRRRNRFLNHLLARFAEQFTDYALILSGLMAADQNATAEKLMRDKQAFLQAYPQISSARGTAFNYLLPQQATNLSGLEQRLRRKLGLMEQDEERFYLVEHILLRPMADDEPQPVPLLAEPGRNDPYSLQLSVVFPDWPVRFQQDDFRQYIERTVREETPAHLIVYIHWLDKTAMDTFAGAHQDWLDKRRHYWLDRLGV